MKIFTFHAPQERLAPKLYKSTQDFTHVNTGKFVRNAVLSSLLYNGSDLAPAFLKTRDAVHPMFGYQDELGNASSVYGGMSASAAVDTARAALNPQNTSTWWNPGGNGVDSWLYAKLPEATLVETYDVGSNSASCPLSWKLQGSLDGTTWADLHTVTTSGEWDATAEVKTFTVPEESRGNYTYYRLYVTSSNATTMGIYRLRLYRAASVCAKGQIVLDASAENPLLMSFADGFDTDGVTPVDYSASITAQTVANVMNQINPDGIAIDAPVPVNIYAVRDDNGAVSIQYENASGTEFVQANGGMASQSDKGWVCSNNVANALITFGNASARYNNASVSTRYQRISGNIYCRRIYIGNIARFNVYVIENDNSQTNITSEISGSSLNAEINRQIKGIYMENYGAVNSFFSIVLLYSPSSPAYRFANGKLYRRATPADAWAACRKVKLGSCVMGTDGDVYQPLAFSALQLQWITQGDAETALQA